MVKGKTVIPTLNEKKGIIQGKTFNINDLIDKVIEVHSVVLEHSDRFDCEVATVSIVVNDEKGVFQTFSQVLIKALKNNEQFQPYRAIIRKIKNYYVLESA